MKRYSTATILAAAALLLAACSSSSGSGTTTSAASSTTTASSEAMSSSAGSAGSAGSSEAMTSDAGTATSGESSGSVAPAALDAQTTAWFDALCTGVAPIKKAESLASQTGSDPTTQQKAVVSTLKTLSEAFIATSASLAGTPPPTFDGGAEFATKVTSGLLSAGGGLSSGATKFAAVDPTDAAAMKAAVATLQTDLESAVKPLQAMSTLDPAVQSATEQIPSCKALGS